MIQRWDDGTVVGLGNGPESGPCLNLVSVTNSRVGSSNPFPYPEPRFLGLRQWWGCCHFSHGVASMLQSKFL